MTADAPISSKIIQSGLLNGDREFLIHRIVKLNFRRPWQKFSQPLPGKIEFICRAAWQGLVKAQPLAILKIF
jgi:hypothetical protein